MFVLVTGATGYVGGRLVPELLRQGHRVRTTVSDSGSQDAPWWADQVETVTMDIMEADQVHAACAGVDTAYFLIHGMGGDDFMEQDRVAATNMRDAVAAQEVSRVVYLSGIIPEVPEAELSEHLQSRLEVERILTDSPATVITLRAAVVMGSGSTSFEIIRQVSERMPVHTVPDWMNSRVQPIAVVDVVAALIGAATIEGPSRHFDVGGPECLPYADLLDRYTEVAGLTRPQVEIPFLPTDLVGTMVGALTDVPASTVAALVESLREDMVCADSSFAAALLPPGHELLGFEDSVRRSLAEGAGAPADRDPMSAMPHDPDWAGGGTDQSFPERVLDTLRSAAEAVRGR
ncbi:MAG: NAD(P)H-binding protein [Austwickia sp.]|nr:NAD(P)H-binding protein [Austwickia sp.]MBK8435341.1 NAD(P)H-binding protein [Austwickia sp.]MBK9101110.1 NAD(P)H-binding protein [Austwickia sp.]